MKVPGKRDLNSYDSLDELLLEKRWLGLSLLEGVQLIEENSLDASEDFDFMGLTGFLYYLGSVREYIFRGMAKEDGLFIKGILGTLVMRADEIINSHKDYSVVNEVLLLVENKFDEIYSDEWSEPKKHKFILKGVKQIYSDDAMCEVTRENLIKNLTKIIMGRKRSNGMGQLMEWEIDPD